MAIKIRKLKKRENVYDITVEDNHNFYANGILVHNCSEIVIPTHDDWSFVCDLSSMNIMNYDSWKNTDAVETLTFFLDAVMTDFINKVEAMKTTDPEGFNFMKRSYNFAVANRALGIGALGWHSYLQSKSIPFESEEAKELNVEIFSAINRDAWSASKKLAELFGEPSLLSGYGRRNTTLTAVAPTTSSAFILGQVSQSIEPIWSNCYVKDTAKLKMTMYNPQLKELLAKKGKDSREIWQDIRDHDGSVQHLDFLSSHEKEVFKTFGELDQFVIIEQAADRQKFIDQSQSLNVMVNPTTPTREVNKLMITAWESGIKSLYYQHSTSAAQDFNRSKIRGGCVNGACEA